MPKTIAFIIFIFISNSVYSSGIPVVDIASLTRMITEGVTRAKEFSESMTEARNRLNAIKDQKNYYQSMMEGHYNFKDIINDPTKNEFLIKTNWETVYSNPTNIQTLRDEFEMNSDDPAVQSVYDNELAAYNMKNQSYSAAVARNQRMQTLLGQFSSATTPAAKADIANAIQFEQTQIQNDAQMLASLEALNEKRSALKIEAKTREHTRKMFNEGISWDKPE